MSLAKMLSTASYYVGYKEKASNANLYSFTENAGSRNYTLFGAWYGMNGVEWCDIFISYCAYYAGEQSSIGKYSYVPTHISYFKGLGRFYSAGITPQAGDIIFFGEQSHVGIVESVSGTTITTVEGNSSNAVSRNTYSVSSSYIYGYGRPDYSDTASTATWHTKATGSYTQDSTEAIENAQKITDYLVGQRGWTINAVCGLLGNIGAESGYNPWRWEGDSVPSTTGSHSSGYGLFQYTPATKYITGGSSYSGFGVNYSNQTGSTTDGEAQLEYMLNSEGYYATETYDLSFSAFAASTAEPAYLARAWLYNYERPADPEATAETRADSATYWAAVLAGYVPGGDIKLKFGAYRDIIRRLILHA